ncbi:hypothetical protein [Aminobacter aminovorans]|uniref:Uncharacterized protein n=1 Tax=Aminobacter aminovorans TaxID=83263 RepID=A0AAC9ARD4_AMIAI|nr:hypothetical protein [Aminobacter aminovorans]AMS41206.1 hypothetical protein AA2016_2278 [Aminobacter aminovorans]MBB3705811.1 hypothetical protein [Aminobacter aminovorans]
MIDIAPTTEAETRNRDLAIAAASQAADALAELLRYAREGDGSMSGAFGTDVVEQLLDAAKMAAEIEGWPNSHEERGQVYASIADFLEGWA